MGWGLVLLLRYSTVWDLASLASLLGTESTKRPSVKCGEGSSNEVYRLQ
jgi:hypothetical protein